MSVLIPIFFVLLGFGAILGLVWLVAPHHFVSQMGARCRHVHYVENRWIQDGTPYVSFRCKDCDYQDRGHVHGDTDGWEGHTET